jgi:hypothetical protein
VCGCALGRLFGLRVMFVSKRLVGGLVYELGLVFVYALRFSGVRCWVLGVR